MARQEEFQLQTDVANLYQNHIAARNVRSKEYIQWEYLSAAPTAGANQCAPDRSRSPRIRAPTTIRLELYLSNPVALIVPHVTLLLMGKDSFGVDIECIYAWWLQFCYTLQFTLVIAHNTATNPHIALGANYVPVPGSVRRFASFDMTILMQNAAALRQDADYLSLLNEWGLRHAGRDRLRDPHRLFAYLNDRGRNSRAR